MSIHIGLENSVMQLKIINGKAKNKSEETGGIGINNVRRRLELLYAGKHELSILNEDEVFIVNLQLQLTAPESSLLQRNYKNEPMNSRIYNCLVVDDSPPAREVLKRYIQKMRMLHLAGECSNALQVLPFLRNQPVDILLLDIQMPQLTGLELVNSLTNPLKNIAFFQL